MAESQFDVVILGGGPAGYVAAIRAAQLGLSVACIERGNLGGVCLNWGCIPTKALLAGAEFYHRLQHDAKNWGIAADNIRHDWPAVIDRSRKVAGQLNRGIASLFKKHKITHLQGHGHIVAPGKVQVRKAGPGAESSWDVAKNQSAADGAKEVLQTLIAKHIIVATGAIARPLPGADYDGQVILGSRDAMSLPEQPKRLIVIGAGAIGMEFAYFYNAFGTKVTVVEMMDRVLPIEDQDVSAAVAKSFTRQGIELHAGHKTVSVKITGQGVEVVIEPAAGGGQHITLTADKVLVAIGVQARLQGVFAADLKPELVKGFLKIDRKTYQTSIPGIYAVGDVNGPPWLAHVASEEAVTCVERIAGHHAEDIDYQAIPGCTYCQPQVASVGQTEQALIAQGKQAGKDYRVGKFPFQASGKAQALGNTEGFVKILSDAKTGEILGTHMVGENVTEMIAQMGLAQRLEATTGEIIATMHAHPTLSEAVHEAALATQGRAIHF